MTGAPREPVPARAAADPFAALAEALRRAGHATAAQRLQDALAGGATGGECLGAAGAVLLALRRELPCLRDPGFTPLVAPCVAAVRAAWPHYR